MIVQASRVSSNCQKSVNLNIDVDEICKCLCAMHIDSSAATAVHITSLINLLRKRNYVLHIAIRMQFWHLANVCPGLSARSFCPGCVDFVRHEDFVFASQEYAGPFPIINGGATNR